MQFTLLPEQIRLHLYKEYRVRALIVLLLALSAAVIIGIVASFPIFIRTYLEQRATLSQDAHLPSEEDTALQNIKKELADDSARLAIVSPYIKNQDFSSVIDSIIALRGSINIVSMTLSRENIDSDTNQSPVSIVLRGISPTRDLLLSFKKKLMAGLPKSTVDLPVSELTQSVDVSFSLQIKNIMP